MLTGIHPHAEANRRYSISETCKLLGICRNTLHNYTLANYIHPVQHSIGARVYYTGAEINRLYEQTI